MAGPTLLPPPGKLALVRARQAFFSALEILPFRLVSSTKYVNTEGALAVPVQATDLLFKGHTRKLAPGASVMQPLTTSAAGAAKGFSGRTLRKLPLQAHAMFAPGVTALLAMHASCASGVTVVGIDNGFGAACALARILRVPA